jgi:hypothetical protein
MRKPSLLQKSFAEAFVIEIVMFLNFVVSVPGAYKLQTDHAKIEDIRK